MNDRRKINQVANLADVGWWENNLAADKSPKRLGDLLGRLAHSAREEVNMRLRIDAGRARTRTSVKVITVATVVFAGLLVLLGGDYLEPYDTFEGQMVIAVIGACFAASFSWLARAFKIDTSNRFLRTGGADS